MDQTETNQERIETHVALSLFHCDDKGVLRLLMAKRTFDRRLFPGLWECGGGKVKQNETFEQAALRELSEEFGVGFMNVEILPFVWTYSLTDSGRTIPGVIIPMLAKNDVVQRLVMNHPLPEHSEVGWFTQAEMREKGDIDLMRHIDDQDGDRSIVSIDRREIIFDAVRGYCLVERIIPVKYSIREMFEERKAPVVRDALSVAPVAFQTTTDDAVQYVEGRFPATVAEFRKIQDEQFRLFCLKQRRYGPGNIAVGQDPSTPEGQYAASVALSVRMNDKTNRLVNMMVVMRGEDAPDETLDDTFMDLSVYGVIAQLVRRGKWGR